MNNVIKGKLLESPLQQQAVNNTHGQFAGSPDLDKELMNAHRSMRAQALNSAAVRKGLKDILLNYTDLRESLRARAEARSIAVFQALLV